MSYKILFDHNSVPIKAVIPNLDPNFFIPTPLSGNITTQEIAEQPYRYHTWINRCARIISMSIARLPKVLINKKKPEEFIDDHEVLDVFMIPNVFMTNPVTFWQAVVLGLLLPAKRQHDKGDTGGQVFLVPLSKTGENVDLRRGEVPAIFYPFTDRLISPIQEGKLDELVGWRYQVPNLPETKIDFALNEIIRINFFNPYEWLHGLSYYSPAQIAMLQDVNADIYNTMFFQNDATVSGVLSSDQHLTDEMYNAYFQRWYDQYGGVGNSRKTAILGAGLKYQQYGQSHADMQFIDQKTMNRKQILGAFGVNEIAVGNYEKINYATIKEGRKMLWQDTYMPIDQQIMSSVTAQWIRYIDKDLMIRSDYSDVEPLREDYKERATAGEKMVKGMDFPPTLAARINNIPLTEENLKKYPWLDEQPKQPTPGFGNGGEEEEEKSKKIMKLNEEEREKFSDDYILRILTPGEKKFKAIMERFFFSQRNRMQDKVDKWLREQEKLVRILNISPNMFMLNILQENESLLQLFKPLTVAQMLREKAKLEEELGSLISWDVTDEKIKEFIDGRKLEIAAINKTTFDHAKKQVSQAIEVAIRDELAPREAAALIKEGLGHTGEVRKNQSMTIARTEIGIISSRSRFQAFHEEGIEFHEWVTAKDERVRTGTPKHPNWDHKKVDGRAVKIGMVFPVVLLKHPLDTNGEVGNIINCRCVAVAAEGMK